MEYTLKKPIEVMNKDLGRYEAQDVINVSFTGKKGLQAIKGLQDLIFKTFTSQSGTAQAIAEDKKPKKDKVVTVDELINILEMTGSSEALFDGVMKALQEFATIGENKLSNDIQEEMNIDDIDELFVEVMKNFLLPKIIQRMNSMNK